MDTDRCRKCRTLVEPTNMLTCRSLSSCYDHVKIIKRAQKMNYYWSSYVKTYIHLLQHKRWQCAPLTVCHTPIKKRDSALIIKLAGRTLTVQR